MQINPPTGGGVVFKIKEVPSPQRSLKVSQKILGVLNLHDVQHSFLISKYHIPLSLNYLKLYIAGKQIS